MVHIENMTKPLLDGFGMFYIISLFLVIVTIKPVGNYIAYTYFGCYPRCQTICC